MQFRLRRGVYTSVPNEVVAAPEAPPSAGPNALDWGNLVSVVLCILFASAYCGRALETDDAWRLASRWGPVHVTVLSTPHGYAASHVVGARNLSIHGYVHRERLEAYLYSDWMRLAGVMECKNGNQTAAEAVASNFSTLPSPSCKCASHAFQALLAAGLHTLADIELVRGRPCSTDKADVAGACSSDNGDLGRILDQINTYKAQVYGPRLKSCVANYRGTKITRPLGNSCHTSARLEPFVIVVGILGASAVNSLRSLYARIHLFVVGGNRVAGLTVWYVLALLTVGPIVICFATAQGTLTLLLFVFALPFTVLFIIDGVTKNSDKNTIVATNTGDPFWVGYIIELPLLSVLADVASNRTDATTIMNGVVTTLAVAGLCTVLGYIMDLYNACMQRARIAEADDPAPENPQSTLKKMRRYLPIMRLSGPDTATEESRIMESVGIRTINYIWSCVGLLWWLVAGKVSMRYFTVSAAPAMDSSGDLRFATEFLLFTLSILPIVDIPHPTKNSTVYPTLWAWPATGRAAKKILENVVLISLAGLYSVYLY